jgi:hypothetical protein
MDGTVAAGGGGGGGGRGYGGPPHQRREAFVQGKVFLGGVDDSLSNESLKQYCEQW